MNVVTLRGQRVTVSAQVKARVRGGGRGAIRVSTSRPDAPPSTWSLVESEGGTSADWTELSVALDVPPDATDLQLQLVVRGDADGWFDDIVAVAGPSPDFVARSLGGDEIEHLRAVATLIGYLRFFHPSDEAAQANWRRLEADAVRRVLGARSNDELRRTLVRLAAAVAPTAEIYEAGHSPRISAPPRPTGGFLTRWIRYGFGGDPYLEFRDGMAAQDGAKVRLYQRLPVRQLAGCRPLALKQRSEVRAGEPHVEFDISPGGEAGDAEPGKAWTPETLTLSDLPSRVTEIEFGVTIRGHGVAGISQLELTCNGAPVADLFTHSDIEGTGHELFKVDRDAQCEAKRCITVSRSLDTQWDDGRDMLDADLGGRLRVRMPTAVWTDGTTTAPRAAAWMPPPVVPGDLAARIATVLDGWLILRWFYPYADDVKVSWVDEFAPAMQKAARARDADELEIAMQELVAKLHDGHAFVNRFTIDGVLPLMLRKIGDRLVVVKTLAPYDEALPYGSTIVAIDGRPVAEALAHAMPRVSAATTAYRDFAISRFLTYGRAGELGRLSVKRPGANGRPVEITVPRLYGSILGQLQEVRRTSGDEVANGIYYVDMSTISQEQLDQLLPKFLSAKAIICDVRGSVSDEAWHLVAQLIDRRIQSPRLLTPIVTAAGPTRYEENRWSVSPRLPHIPARPIFLADGRSMSQDETVLAMVKTEHIGTIVGEPTAGTNGNMIIYDTLGRMKILFTGMRVLNADGTLLHGHGITPDVAVHATVEGIAAGKDEILEAAVRLGSGRS